MNQSVHLTRRQPARNMARFYRIEIAPDLLGGVVIIRHWGRIGTPGRECRCWLADAAQAQVALQSWALRKQRRGYRPD